MSTSPVTDRKKVTIHTLRAKKERGEPIAMLTAYDYPGALAVDRAGVDAILVGDSLGMVVLGYDTTLPVTMEDMLHHCKAVARGAQTAHLIGDMPFMSYQVSVQEAVRNAGRFLQEGRMESVKLEGGRQMAQTIEAIVEAGIPVMGHIGLTPQSVNKLGGWKTQGKTAEAAQQLVEDAHVLEEAGCYAIVLEAIPDRVAELISHRLTVPTIGIGAGAGCDGQVLVLHDLLGLYARFTPRLVKQYASLHTEINRALTDYLSEVKTHRFPAAEHSHSIADAEFRELLDKLEAI